MQDPETGVYGDNILMKGRAEWKIQYSFQAMLREGKNEDPHTVVVDY